MSPVGNSGTLGAGNRISKISRRTRLFQLPFSSSLSPLPRSRKNPLVYSIFSSDCCSALDLVVFSFSVLWSASYSLPSLALLTTQMLSEDNNSAKKQWPSLLLMPFGETASAKASAKAEVAVLKPVNRHFKLVAAGTIGRYASCDTSCWELL